MFGSGLRVLQGEVRAVIRQMPGGTGPSPEEGTVGSVPVSVSVAARSERWGVLDALRGFALCGTLFVNLSDLLALHVG